MGDRTGIGWTNASWNPVTGCSHVSDGCRFCYAEALSLRYGWSKKPWTAQNAAENVVFHPERLDQPLRWRKPRRVFVNSMSDLFHERVPDSYIAAVFGIMAVSWQHTFQILTKRPERARFWFADHCGGDPAEAVLNGLSEHMDGDEESNIAVANYITGWSRWRAMPDDGNPLNGTVPRWPLPNVWLGVSVEDQRRADERIPILLETPAAVRWVSCEPLIGSLDLRRYFHDRKRKGVLGPSGAGLVSSRTERGDMEVGGVSGRRGGIAEMVDESVPGRAEHVGTGRLPEGDFSGRRPATEGLGAQDRMDGGKQGRYPGRNGDQSPRRDQVAQPPLEFRDGHQGRERQARDTGFGPQAEGPGRRNERDGAPSAGTGHGNPSPVGDEVNDTAGDRGAVRRQADNCAERRQPQFVEAPSLNWLVCGGESGPGHRPMDPAWLESIVRQCQTAKVPCYVKQDSGARPGQQGRIPDDIWAVKDFPE